MIVGDAVILGSGGGETASIFAIGDVLETDTVYAEKGGKHINGVWKSEANPAWLNLPSAYQQVEYLQSAGAQWIDLGIKGNETSKLVSTIINEKQPGEAAQIFGDITDTSMGISFNVEFFYQGSSGVARFGAKTISLSLETFALNTEYDVTISNDAYLIDDTVIWRPQASAFTTQSNLFLFNANGSSGRFVGKIKNSLYTDSGHRISLIPCYRKSDHKPGMYDTANGVFYVNQGTGADFTVGADIPQYIGNGFEVKSIDEYGTWTLTAKRANRVDIVKSVLIDATDQFVVEV